MIVNNKKEEKKAAANNAPTPIKAMCFYCTGADH
jgi:hypothetical protein